ncbi:hypothetical protein GCM10022225_45020 [Plantactinospora mayteni]|uniref:hypothetical protein n=1 Tax=Plantactinospora mayteni TaxID=566021 RepID=UPI0019428516|nr:hypothetical protein [Plantactinospora mayteni]
MPQPLPVGLSESPVPARRLLGVPSPQDLDAQGDLDGGPACEVFEPAEPLLFPDSDGVQLAAAVVTPRCGAIGTAIAPAGRGWPRPVSGGAIPWAVT